MHLTPLVGSESYYFVNLPAMRRADMNEWKEDYFPVRKDYFPVMSKKLDSPIMTSIRLPICSAASIRSRASSSSSVTRPLDPDYPMSVRDAARYLGVSAQTVYLWVERKQKIESKVPEYLRNVIRIMTETGLRIYKELTPKRLIRYRWADPEGSLYSFGTVFWTESGISKMTCRSKMFKINRAVATGR